MHVLPPQTSFVYNECHVLLLPTYTCVVSDIVVTPLRRMDCIVWMYVECESGAQIKRPGRHLVISGEDSDRKKSSLTLLE